MSGELGMDGDHGANGEQSANGEQGATGRPSTADDLSAAITRAVEAVPAVRSVIPPGPALAVLVENARRALDVPRGRGAVLVRTLPDGVEVRVVVEVRASTSALDTVREVRDVVLGVVTGLTGVRPVATTVWVVEIR